MTKWIKIIFNFGCIGVISVVKVDRRIRLHYSDYIITVLRFCIGARQHKVSK